MMTRPPLCMNCTHFDTENEVSLTCRAFPQGIPARILNNSADHRRAYAGDGGLRYEAIDPAYDIPESLRNDAR